jgi:hypothetical protein
VPRLLVSIPVHEQPPVVLDQVENLRAFLPADTQVVLHLSRALGVDPAEVAPLLPEGVHVNPVSHATAWGDIALLHNANVRFAFDALEPFDHVLLHASNDMYIKAGAEAHVAGAQAGVHDLVCSPDMDWLHGPVAVRDPVLAAMLADAGGGPVLGGQVEGSFFGADLFAAMLEIMERRWSPGEGEAYTREEVFYPTLAGALATGRVVEPIVFSDASAFRQDVSPAIVAGLIDGTYREDPDRPDRGTGASRMYDFDHLYAVKRVGRTLHDPQRMLIRGLAHARGRRLRVAPPFSARGFVGLTWGSDVIADPALLRAWMDVFGADDDVTLAIHLDPGAVALTEAVVAAVADAGGDEPGGADLALVTTWPGSFADAALRHAVDVVFRPDDAETPKWLDVVPRLGPGAAGHLRFLAAGRPARGAC